MSTRRTLRNPNTRRRRISGVEEKSTPNRAGSISPVRIRSRNSTSSEKPQEVEDVVMARKAKLKEENSFFRKGQEVFYDFSKFPNIEEEENPDRKIFYPRLKETFDDIDEEEEGKDINFPNFPKVILNKVIEF